MIVRESSRQTRVGEYSLKYTLCEAGIMILNAFLANFKILKQKIKGKEMSAIQ